MGDTARGMLFALISIGAAVSMFILADAAMPDEVKWWMRWLLAGVAFVCFLAGGAVAAYLMHERTKDVIQREREKNAELAARLEEFNSEERRKREVFDVLNEREKWCLAHVIDDWPKKHSVSGSVILASYDVLTRAGILVDQGSAELHGQTAYTYTIALEWRKWVFDHSDELPEADLNMPT